MSSPSLSPLVVLAAAFGCVRAPLPLNYSLYAGAGDRADGCSIAGTLRLPRNEFDEWKGTTQLHFQRVRIRNEVRLPQDSIINKQRIRLERVRSEKESWRLLLLNPIVDSIALRQMPGRSAADNSRLFLGEWMCGRQFPFADDSTRNPHGRIELLVRP
jgi:hypothetical protein